MIITSGPQNGILLFSLLRKFFLSAKNSRRVDRDWIGLPVDPCDCQTTKSRSLWALFRMDRRYGTELLERRFVCAMDGDQTLRLYLCITLHGLRDTPSGWRSLRRLHQHSKVRENQKFYRGGCQGLFYFDANLPT